MFEDDAILPDDFQESQPQAEEAPEVEEVSEQVESPAEDTKPAEESTPTEPETPKLKIKYNSEEREIPLDEAAILAQKGLNYEKAVERAKQEARDAYIAEQGWSWNGKPITTEAEYKQALIEQELINKYKDSVPQEVIQELIENRRDREERKKEKEENAKAKEEADKKAKLEAENYEFLDYFKEINGRFFDPAKDKVPAEVITAANNGKPLKVAYMEYQNKQLLSQLQVLKQNEENTKKAPVGSVTAHGSTETASEDDFMRGFNSI